MARRAIPTWCFALVVVRMGHRFLVVQERKHGQRWYLPAGRVEPGETFAEAAVRETMEEAGIPIVIEGIHRIEHTPSGDGTARLRMIFVARPEGDRAPKAVSDEHTLRAAWATLDELAGLPMRGDEVIELFASVQSGAPIYPLALLGAEPRR